MNDFEIGDIVKLKTGGREMIVDKIFDECVIVCFFHEGNFSSENLNCKVLKKATSTGAGFLDKIKSIFNKINKSIKGK